jgi:hypothetical protein
MGRKAVPMIGPKLRAVLVVATAVALTAVFWPKLWQGSGLVGGDIYAYYLPQKAFYAECLREGTLPFWNNRIGNGYPQLAESQTGALYPLNVVLYRWLDLNTASNASVLFHYALAFVGCWLLARRLHRAPLAAALAALVYTYSWFPPRISLEWAIIGGTWLPLAVWCVESFVQQRLRRWLVMLTIVLALQLLAGHFLIAFLTQLLIVCYVPIRIWLAGADLSETTRSRRGITGLSLTAAIAGSYFVAAAQLVPTWELKRLSQRSGVSGEHDPSFGAVPPKYLLQVVAPWAFYPDRETFAALHDPHHRERINRIDAHLYFGMLPLVLIAAGLFPHEPRAANLPPVHGGIEGGHFCVDGRVWYIWFGLGIMAILYMPGWFVPITQHLPGFSFFEGPGRYGIVATLAAALLAGAGFQAVRSWLPPLARPLFAAAVFALTTRDLIWVSDLVHDAEPMDNPPIKRVAESTLYQTVIASHPNEPARVFSEAHNVPSLVGAGTLPVYLGLSPSAYYNPQLMLPRPNPFRDTLPTPEQLDWLKRMGVSHILSVSPLDSDVWPIRLLWDRPDPCLNPILVLGPTKALVLYELEGTRGRAAWQEHDTGPPPRVVSYTAHRVEIAAESAQGGTLVLTDLDYPGWEVAVDGRPAQRLVVDGMLRGVALPPGKHTVIWSFRPKSFYCGAGISAVSLVALVVFACRRK